MRKILRAAALLFVGGAFPFHPSMMAPEQNVARQGPARSLQTRNPDRVSPDCRLTSPLDRVIAQVRPGQDAFSGELYNEEILARLKALGQRLCQSSAQGQTVAELLAADFRGAALLPGRERSSTGTPVLEIFRGEPETELELGREQFTRQFIAFLDGFEKLSVAEFHILQISARQGPSPEADTVVDYDLVGVSDQGEPIEKTGQWKIAWRKQPEWNALRWTVLDQTRARASRPFFVDVSSTALEQNPSFVDQFGPGIDYWRARLDGALGIDVFGNNGVAAGDIDGDGWDDVYVCQPAGLPNRLYRNRGDGTFEDVTEAAGVAVLDSSSAALLADIDNDADQDLIVVTWKQPLLFLNNGSGQFSFRPDAFRFVQAPRGALTSAALADYDRDGFLDLYVCVYNYFLGEGSYRLATPYHDANNGPPNILFRNDGRGGFVEMTRECGLNENNNRFSFACAWADYNNDGWPDLYVANDFGRNNLYRNNGPVDGRVTFSDVAAQAGVEDIGAGMSVAWFDYNNDGWMDLYVGNMWSAAGRRLAAQPDFQPAAPPAVRDLYRRHARGNSLFRNRGDGTFEEVSLASRTEKGRWAWSADALDFDADGWQDLYVANGFITNSNPLELESFFWRQVVAQSPLTATPTATFEDGWRAINRLIREDGTWNGNERNVLLRNNGAGSFDSMAGVAGLDFNQDSRAFALTDFDGDGDQDLFLKSRTSPQLRLLRNDFRSGHAALSFRLTAKAGNRDAIGARVTVVTDAGRQTRCLQAGSGFLSQNSKVLFFGLGKARRIVQVLIDWPGGRKQTLESVPLNHFVRVQEGNDTIVAEPFRSAGGTAPAASAGAQQPAYSGTWLIDPYPAPDFRLTDTEGRPQQLSAYSGRPVLLTFWAVACIPCRSQLKAFQESLGALRAAGGELLAVAVDSQPKQARLLARRLGTHYTVVLADDRMLGVYNLLVKYLFDKNENLELPSTLLVDAGGSVVKVYRGMVGAGQVAADLKQIDAEPRQRLARALPFDGQFYASPPGRNYFQFGIAFSEKGFVEPALLAFEKTVTVSPDFADAHYNLGTLYARANRFDAARASFERALEVRPAYPEAHNNLGTLLAEKGDPSAAVAHFKAALEVRSDYPEALNNLGRACAQLGRTADALEAFQNALRRRPDFPEALNNLGILWGQQGDLERARSCFERALEVRRDFPEAANNLAMIWAAANRYGEALVVLRDALAANPDFDQTYLTLARIYLLSGQKAEAAAILRQLILRNPNHRAALEMLKAVGSPNNRSQIPHGGS